MKKIILVRHGEALGNKTRELMGCRIGSELSEKGKKQSLLLSEYLIFILNTSFYKIYYKFIFKILYK